VIVAIDGPAGAGKSTIAARCGEALGFVYLNSGAIYRAVTWKALQQGEAEAEPSRIVELARSLRLEYQDGHLLVDGERRDKELHADRVDRYVSRHSAIKAVRAMVNERLRQIAVHTNVVVEGRDITTVVFPHADVKIFLDASVETRARRRWEQHESDLSLEQIHQRIAERDEADKKKQTGSLKQADDAIYLNTSVLTIDQVCETVINTIRETQKNQESQGHYGR
jgi:cytidylate kinase